jgi:hypothetical protein
MCGNAQNRAETYSWEVRVNHLRYACLLPALAQNLGLGTRWRHECSIKSALSRGPTRFGRRPRFFD